MRWSFTHRWAPDQALGEVPRHRVPVATFIWDRSRHPSSAAREYDLVFVERGEWDEEPEYPRAPLPAHERQWRHPSEQGATAWSQSEPPLVATTMTLSTSSITLDAIGATQSVTAIATSRTRPSPPVGHGPRHRVGHGHRRRTGHGHRHRTGHGHRRRIGHGHRHRVVPAGAPGCRSRPYTKSQLDVEVPTARQARKHGRHRYPRTPMTTHPGR